MRHTVLTTTALAALFAILRIAEEAVSRHAGGPRDPAGGDFHSAARRRAASLVHAGKYTTPDRHRADELGTVPGKDGVRLTGLSLPFDGQAVQGFSGIKNMGDGTFWSLSDNGFGNEAELGRRRADAASPEVRLGQGHGRPLGDDLPVRPRQ